jgi:hypothetical protein
LASACVKCCMEYMEKCNSSSRKGRHSGVKAGVTSMQNLLTQLGRLTGQACQHRLESGWNLNGFGDQDLSLPL